MKLSIRVKLIMLLVILLVAGIGTVGYLGYDSAEGMALDMVEEKLAVQSEDWARTVDAYISESQRIRERENELIKDKLQMQAEDWRRIVISEMEKAGETNDLEELKDMIASVVIGETGYIYVLGGEGEDKGHYIVSKNRERDGEDIWYAKDADGRLFIQDIVYEGMKTPEEAYLIEYPWRNQGEEQSYLKIAAITYVEELDWVIGASAYFKDFQSDIEGEMVERLKDSIASEKIGKTGYIYVLGGEGSDKGHYIVSKNRERDGEDLWDSKDADGRLFIQEIVNEGMKTPEEAYIIYYPWQNIGENSSRQKIAAVTYVPEWDWVIGASAYHSDFLDPIDDQKNTTIVTMIVGLVVAIAVGGIFASTLTNPIKKLKNVAEKVSMGDLDVAVDVKSRDEIGDLAQSFERMVVSVKILSQEDEEEK